MRIIVPRYRMHIPELRNDRCDGSSHLVRHNDSWQFPARFTISFVSVDIYYVQRIIGC